MSIGDMVAPHLPYLRRYARALTGSQASGDTYVANVLQTLIADPSLIRDARSPRNRLYHILSRSWGSLPVNLEKDSDSHHWERTAQDKLNSLSPLNRQAFLLRAVENFSVSDIAEILGHDDSDVRHLLKSAEADVASMIASDVMIIEDEPLIAMDIEDLVTSLGHRSIGIARTHAEALQLAKDRKPDLILSDIQLADGSSGIDAVNDLLQSFDVPVVFITAFPERLLTGTRPEPAFLITKPFSPDMVKAVISQAMFFDVTAGQAAQRRAS